MVMYLEAITKDPDVYVDYVEILKYNGEVISLDWDRSGICRTDTGFATKYSGVYFNGECADGMLNTLGDNIKLAEVGLYSENIDSEFFPITIVDIEFEDNGVIKSFPINTTLKGVKPQ